MCKGSLLVRITFSFLFLFSLSLLLPVHFYSSFVILVKMALELLKYIHTQRGKRKSASRLLSLSRSFRVTVHSYMYACARSMDGYNITSQHTHTHAHTHTHHQEKRSEVEARRKTCSNFFFSFPPLLLVLFSM